MARGVRWRDPTARVGWRIFQSRTPLPCEFEGALCIIGSPQWGRYGPPIRSGSGSKSRELYASPSTRSRPPAPGGHGSGPGGCWRGTGMIHYRKRGSPPVITAQVSGSESKYNSNSAGPSLWAGPVYMQFDHSPSAKKCSHSQIPAN